MSLLSNSEITIKLKTVLFETFRISKKNYIISVKQNIQY